jgi:hypothetical protein
MWLVSVLVLYGVHTCRANDPWQSCHQFGRWINSQERNPRHVGSPKRNHYTVDDATAEQEVQKPHAKAKERDEEKGGDCQRVYMGDIWV